ncbi:hypothetical protein N309_14686, partial [Tinamus guttatus]
PTWEFLVCGLGEGAPKGCRHCPAEWESCSHITGYCPVVQEARIKRHNNICGVLTEEAWRVGWEIYVESHLRDNNNELFKLDLIMVKGCCAKVVDVTVHYESGVTTLSDAVAEKDRKYQHLVGEIRTLTSANEIEFLGFPIGTRGKWCLGNDRLLSDFGVSTSHCKRVA